MPETLRYLRQAVKQRESSLPLIAAEPHFQFLKGNKEFDGILRQIGLSP